MSIRVVPSSRLTQPPNTHNQNIKGKAILLVTVKEVLMVAKTQPKAKEKLMVANNKVANRDNEDGADVGEDLERVAKLNKQVAKVAKVQLKVQLRLTSTKPD